MKNKINFAIEP